MQIGVASRGAHIETVAGFLVAEKMFLEGRRDGAEVPERSLWPVNVALFGFYPVLARILLRSSG
jgi:hypothetical protein